MKRRILWSLLGITLAYYSVGIALLAAQVISELPLAPGGYHLQYGGGDQVGYGLEGPVLRYEKEGLVAYRIGRNGPGLRPLKQAVTQQDTLFCETDSARFPVSLPDSLLVPKSEMNISPSQPIVVVSDVEGNFSWFSHFLRASKIVDQQLSWAFGTGHLVLLGDYFDRGTDVLPCLWLAYQLEQQARRAGGQVHFMLGNHDVMNLTNQTRYVRNKYFINADSLRLPYAHWFDHQSELGRWLRTKNTVERINQYLFCHAGIHPATLTYKLSIPDINERVRAALDRDPKRINEQADPITYHLMRQNGPLWYRGYFQPHDTYEQATQVQVDSVLRQYRAAQLIVGHTPVEAIKPTYAGKVIGIDVLRKLDNGQNKPSALLIQNNQFFTLDDKGTRLKISL